MNPSDEDIRASLSATRRSLKQVLRGYIDVNDTNDLFDVLSDLRVVNAQKILDEPLSSWFAVEYKLMSAVIRAAGVYLRDERSIEQLRSAVESLRKHRSGEKR